MKNIKYIPLCFFIAFGAKSLILHPSIEECAITLALCAMTYGFEFFAEKKDINHSLKQIKDLSERLDELAKKTDNNQTQIASVKLNSGIRTQRMG